MPPARRMALSNTLRPPTMTTSFFSPSVLGSCQTLSGSVPAMHPAVATAMAPAAPEVIMPDSAPVSSARRLPAALLQIEDVYEVLRGLYLSGSHFGQFEAGAEIGPGSTPIDQWLHTKPGVDVVGRVAGNLCPAGSQCLLQADLCEQRERLQPISRTFYVSCGLFAVTSDGNKGDLLRSLFASLEILLQRRSGGIGGLKNLP